MDDYFPLKKYPRYLIKVDGTLLDTQTNRIKTWYMQKPQKVSGGRNRNMRRGYLITRIKTPDGKKRHIFQHRVLAELFVECHGDPDTLLVNHKDGNGGNNTITNLEWVTYSKNMEHAYATGLCTGTTPIETLDRQGNFKEYLSLANCAKDHDLPETTLKNRLNKNPGKFYENGFAYRYRGSNIGWIDETVKTVKPKMVFGLNVINGRLTIARDQKELSDVTGVPLSTISATLLNGRITPTSGYIFGWEGTLIRKPVYTPRQVELFKLDRPKSDTGGWVIVDNYTNTERVVLLKQFSKELNESIGKVTGLLNKGISSCGRYTYAKVSPVAESFSPLME